MGFDFGALARNMGVPTATVGVEDLSQHVDGGESSVGTVRSLGGSAEGQSVVHFAAGIVIAAIVLLWFFGGIAFRGIPSV